MSNVFRITRNVFYIVARWETPLLSKISTTNHIEYWCQKLLIQEVEMDDTFPDGASKMTKSPK